jgi:hypothetical protein
MSGPPVASRRLPGVPLWLGLALMAAGPGCDDAPPPPAPASLLPAGYQQGYPVVRSCRNSIEHDLRYIVIRVLAGTEAQYETGPFPRQVGTLIIKEEFSDRGCGDLLGWTLMRKEAAGYDGRHGDWHWQRLDATGKVTEDGPVPRCASCHALPACQARDFACAEP